MGRVWREKNPDYLRAYYLAHREGEPTPTVVTNGQKPCSTCGRSKPLDAFHKQKDGVGGRRAQCIACRREAHRANPEPTRERVARNRARNPNYMREWREANPDLVLETHIRRRLRLTGQTMGHTPEYMAQVAGELRAQPCSYCGGPGGEVDHIVPLARGGLHHPQNLAAACRSCNASKNDRLPSEWDGPPTMRNAA